MVHFGGTLRVLQATLTIDTLPEQNEISAIDFVVLNAFIDIVLPVFQARDPHTFMRRRLVLTLIEYNSILFGRMVAVIEILLECLSLFCQISDFRIFVRLENPQDQ